jgi:hypothetical protein
MKLSPRLLALETLALLVFAAIAGAAFLAWRLAQGPIDLEPFRGTIERSLGEATGDGRVTVRSLALEWSADRRRAQVAARDLAVFDAAGLPVSTAERAVISFNSISLLSGQLVTERLRLENARASVRRDADGVWTLAGAVLFREPAFADPNFNPFTQIGWQTIATPLRAIVAGGSLRRVDLAGLKIDVDDEKTGSVWAVDPINGQWTTGDEGVRLEVTARLLGRTDPNEVRIALSTDRDVSRAVIGVSLDGVDPASLVRVLDVPVEIAEADAPADAAFNLTASETGGLEGAGLAVSGLSAAVVIDGITVAVRSLSLEALYRPDDRRIVVSDAIIDSDRLSGEFAGTIDVEPYVSGRRDSETAFTLEARRLSLNLAPAFEGEWLFDRLALAGDAHTGLLGITLETLSAVSGKLNVTGAGRLWSEGPPDRRRLGVKLDLQGEGTASIQQILSFWPLALGMEARSWVAANIPKGAAGRLRFSTDWPPDAESAGLTLRDRLQLDFDISDTSLRFLPDFPLLTELRGKGRLTGDSLAIDVAGGRLGGWSIDAGEVQIPRFAKSPAVEVWAKGRGGFQDIMTVLDRSDLRVGSAYGIAPGRVAGAGEANVRVRHDLRPEARPHFEIDGVIRGASVPDLYGALDLDGALIKVDVDPRRVLISGTGRFAASPVTFEWTETTAGPQRGSRLSASGKISANLFNEFGLAVRSLMQGEADVELEATGKGRDFRSVDATVDLTPVSIDIAEAGWRKPAGIPAMGAVRYTRPEAGPGKVRADLRSDGVELIAEARMMPDGALQSAAINRLYSRGSVDLAGSLTRRPDGGYYLNLSGPLLDAAPFTDRLLGLANEAAGGTVSPSAASAGLVEVELSADRLRLRSDAQLTEARISVALASANPVRGRITGAIDKDRKIDVRLASDGGARTLAIRSDDAGFGARVLLNADYLSGGELTLNGRFDGDRGEAQLSMTNVRLRDAPLVAQILSLASLRGLADVLAGEGVLFSRIDSPVMFENGRISLPALRAAGPAMGFTARGWIAPLPGELSLDGVLVPSFGVNSALGSIPLIGDLFVSRKGEGLFAPTYAVRGTLSKARITVNPIAAVTPGMLRRIFEAPQETPPPPGLETAPQP